MNLPARNSDPVSSHDRSDEVIIKVIPGFPDYAVTTDGEIFSFKRKVPLKLRPRVSSSTGYPGVSLCRNGEIHSITVHSAVALAFIGPRPDGHVVRHLDGNPENCVLSNLAYGTYAQNEDDKARHGRRPVGQAIYNSKLTPHDVADIRRMYASGSTHEALLKIWPINPTSMHRVVHGHVWKHLPVPDYSQRPKREFPKDWHPSAKLAPEDAKRIKILLSSGHRSREISAEIGISYSTVRRIAQGNAWRHV